MDIPYLDKKQLMNIPIGLNINRRDTKCSIGVVSVCVLPVTYEKLFFWIVFWKRKYMLRRSEMFADMVTLPEVSDLAN